MRIIRHVLLCLFISASVSSVSAVNWSRIITPSVRVLFNRIRSNGDNIATIAGVTAWAFMSGAMIYYAIRNDMRNGNTTPHVGSQGISYTSSWNPIYRGR